MSEIEDWYNRIPFFTRQWFTLSVILPVAARFNLISPMSLILTSKYLRDLELWRPFTATFYYPTGFHYLMNLYFLYNYSLRLELSPEFYRKPADYLFMLLLNWFTSLLMAHMFGIPLLMDAMVLSVLYIWCQFNKNQVVSFLFGLRLKALYFPFLLLGFNMLMGGNGILEIVGILVGHVYYFLMHVYPQKNNGLTLLSTPEILKRYFPDRRVSTYGPAQPSSDQSRTRGHTWGTGYTLGGG